MGKQISDLTVRIGADTLGFTSGMKKAKGETDMFEKGISSLKGAVVGAFAVGSVIAFGSASAQAYNKQAQAENLLLTAVKGRTDVQQRLMAQASQLSKNSLFPDDELVNQQKYLASLGMQESQIKRVIAASVELSAATGMGLEEAVKNLAKTYGGLTGELGESIPGLKALTVEQLKNGEAVAYIEKNYKGFAETAANAGTGSFTQLANDFTNMQEAVGGLVVDGMKPFVGFLREAVQGVTEYISVPYSDKLKEEQDDLNILTKAVMGANEGTNARKGLMDELNSKYPKFLANLDKEKITNEQLAARLREVNDQYKNRIAAAVIDEDEIKLKTKGQKLQRQIREFGKDVSRLWSRTYSDIDANIAEEAKKISDPKLDVVQTRMHLKVKQFYEELKSLGETPKQSDLFFKVDYFGTKGMGDVGFLWQGYLNKYKEIQGNEAEINRIAEELVQLASERASILKDTKIDADVIPGVDVDKNLKAAGSIAALNEQLTKLREKIENFPEAEKRLKLFGDLKAEEDGLKKRIQLLEDYRNRVNQDAVAPIKSKQALVTIAPSLKLEGVETYSSTLKDTVDITEGATSVMKSSFGDLAMGIGESFGAMATGAGGMETLVYSVLGAFAGFIKKFGEMMITTAIAGLALSKAMKNLFNPASWGVALGAGVLLVATGSAMQSSMTKATSPTPKLAQGGLAFGPTLALVGDNANARTDPEVIAPLSKLKTLNGGGDINLVGKFRIEGQDLVYVLQKANQQRKLQQ